MQSHHLLLVRPGGVSELPEDFSGFLSLQLSNFNLPLDIFFSLEQEQVVILFLNELLGVINLFTL
jgi:hypothetical protein